MTQPSFGLQFNFLDDAVLSPIILDFSTIGIVLPSDDANATMFPLNTPVDINTGDATVLANLGTGDLYKAILAINSQLVNLQRSARAVVVRVAQGGSVALTMANIIGSPSAGSGIYALLKAPALLGVTPRIIIAPGYTGAFNYSGGSVAVTKVPNRIGGNVGNGTVNLASPAYLSGWQPGVYQITCIGGTTHPVGATKPGGNLGQGTIGSLSSVDTTTIGTWRVICNATATNGGTFQVFLPNGTFDGLAVVGTPYISSLGLHLTITAAGTDFAIGDEFDVTVSEIVPTNAGEFSVTDPFGNPMPEANVAVAYANQIGFTIADGGIDYQIGDAFAITVAVTGGSILANPLVAALPPVLEALMAHAICDGPGTSSKTDAILWQTTIQSKRIIPVDDPVVIEKLDGTGTEFAPLSAYVAGIAVAVDFGHQGFPFFSFANQPIQGILGLKRIDSFSLLDGATDGQELLANGVGIAVRGDHSDASLTDSGWSHVSWSNASTDPQWTFYNKTRGRDWIHLTLLKNIRTHLGRENITPHSVQSVINSMIAVAMNLMATQNIIGFKVGFDPSVNTPDNLRAGSFRVFWDSEEPAPILVVTIDSGLDRSALVSEIATLAQTTAGVIGTGAV